MKDPLKEWKEFWRKHLEEQEDRKIRQEYLSKFYLKQERIFRLLAKAAKKRAYSRLEDDISVSDDDFILLLHLGYGTLINPNTPINDNCYLQRVEVQGHVFRTITTYAVPYRPDVRVK